MSESRAMFLRKGLVGTCALVALVLLASFYSIVSGAVDRAARQRSVASEGYGAAATSALPARPVRSNGLLARVGS
jgi:hypothetical protein